MGIFSKIYTIEKLKEKKLTSLINKLQEEEKIEGKPTDL